MRQTILAAFLALVMTTAAGAATDATPPYADYTATTSQTEFSFPHEVRQASDLDVLTSSDGTTWTTETYGVDYTLSGLGDDDGVTVTFTTAPGSGVRVLLRRDSAIGRITDWASGGFSLASLNAEFDQLTRTDEELEDGLNRCVRGPTTNADFDGTLPLDCANKYLKGSADGDGVTCTPAAAGATAGDSDGGTWSTVIDTIEQRSGTTATRRAVTPAEGECGFDTTYRAYACGDGSTPGGVDVSGYPFFDVKFYGATGDGVTDDNTAVQAALTAAKAADGIMIFPPGTYKISTALDLSATADNGLQIWGIGKPTVLMSDLTEPVVILGARNVIDGLTLRYATRPGASDLRAVGIQLGTRDSAVESTQSTVRNVSIERTFVGIQAGANVPAGEADTIFGSGFSNTYDNVTIRDFYYSAIVLNRASSGGLAGGNNTGDSWSNIYINGKQYDSSTRVNPAGDVVYLRQHVGSVFNQLNIESIGDTTGSLASPSYTGALIDFGAGGGETNSLVVNSLHVEDVYTAASGGAFFEMVDNAALVLNGFMLNGNEWAVGGGNFYNLVRFSGDRSNVVVDGLTLQGNTLTSGTFRYAATNGSKGDNEVWVFGYAPGDDDTAILVDNTSGYTTSDGQPLVKQINDTRYYGETHGQGTFAPFPHGTLTLDANGVIALAGDEMFTKVDTYSSASTDNLDGISETPAPVDGQILILRTASSSRDITVRPQVSVSNADSFFLAGDAPVPLTTITDRLVLQFESDTGRWVEIGRRVASQHTRLQFRNTDALTVASNTITPTASRHTIDNSGGTATVSTITPPDTSYDGGYFLILSTSTTGNAVTIADYSSGSDNIYSGANCTLDNTEDVWVGMYGGLNLGWWEIACQDNN
jgi:hypothetical protein